MFLQAIILTTWNSSFLFFKHLCQKMYPIVMKKLLSSKELNYWPASGKERSVTVVKRLLKLLVIVKASTEQSIFLKENQFKKSLINQLKKERP